MTMQHDSRSERLIALDQITTETAFSLRRGRQDRRHRDNLAAAVKRTGRPLDPILLWRDDSDTAAPLVLLDGEYRIAAYRRAGWTDEVPARVIVCDRREALLEALRANVKDTVPLTSSERLDAAWRLVRQPMERRYTVPEVSKAAGIAARTVDNMRKRLREMQIEGREPTGDWHRDKRLPPVDDGGAILTDAQRKKGIADLTKAIRDLLDRRKHIGMPILRDAGAVDDALIEALGEKRIVALYDYLHGEGDEYDYDEVPDDDAEDRLRADYAF